MPLSPAAAHRGSISTVELALHTLSGKQVVLKCYHKAKMQVRRRGGGGIAW